MIREGVSQRKSSEWLKPLAKQEVTMPFLSCPPTPSPRHVFVDDHPEAGLGAHLTWIGQPARTVKATQQLQRRLLVPPLLDQNVEHLALVIDGPPQIHPSAADLHDDLIEMPAAGRRTAASAQVCRDQRAELDDPATDRLAADLDPALRHQLLDVPDAEREPEIPAHCLHDDRCRETVTLETDRAHSASWPSGPDWGRSIVRLPAPR